MNAIIYISSLIFCVIQVTLSAPTSSLRIQPYGEPAYIWETHIILTCSYAAGSLPPNSFIRWINQDNEVIDAKYIEKQSDNSYTLRFIDQSVLKEGNYTCQRVTRVDNKDTINDERSVMVKFAREPSFENCPSSQYLIKNEKGRIKCEIIARPQPLVSWTKDGQSLHGFSQTFSIDSKGVQIIAPVTEKLNGVYTLSLTTIETGRYTIYNVSVVIVEKPIIKEIRSELPYLIEGKQTRLECVGDETVQPRPRFFWLNANKRNLSESGNADYEVNTETGELLIKNGKPEEAGNFTCIAKNDFGTAERQMTVLYAEKPVFIPEISDEVTMVTALVGMKVKFECEVKHSELKVNLTIRKRHEEGELPSSDNGQRLVTLSGDKSLTGQIMSVQKDDRGDYECVAESIGGTVTRKYKLVTLYPPIIRPPSGPVKFFSTKSSVNLTCEVDANPPATIKWFLRGQDVSTLPDFKRRYKIHYIEQTGSLLEVLRIDGANMNNNFECQATSIVLNNQEQRAIQIRLEEARPPGPVTAIVKQAKQRRLTLTVTENFNHGLEILKYIVKYYPLNNVSAITESSQHPGNKNNEIVISDLTPDTQYSIQIASVNEAGVGEFGVPMNLKTTQISVPEKVAFLNDNAFSTITGGDIISDQPNDFTVKWSLPDDNGSPISSYTLKFYEVARKDTDFERIGDVSQASIQGNDPLVYKLTGLKADSFYQVDMEAFNEKGPSELSYIRFKTAKPVITNNIDDNVDQRPPNKYGVISLVLLALIVVLIIAIIIDIVISINCRVGLSYRLCPSLFSSASMAVKGDDVIRSNTNNHHQINEEQAPMMDKSSGDANAKLHKDSSV